MAAWGSNAFLAAVQVSINQTQVLYPELGSLETRVSKFYLDELFAGEHNSSMNDTGTYWQLSYPNSLPLLPVSDQYLCLTAPSVPVHPYIVPAAHAQERVRTWKRRPIGSTRQKVHAAGVACILLAMLYLAHP